MGLFPGNGDNKKNFALSSILGKGGKCVGDLLLEDSIHVSGEVQGNIQARGEVILEQGSFVSGSVEGRRVVIAGRVMGSVKSHTTVELSRTAQVEGDISADKLMVEEGAQLSGRVETDMKGGTELLLSSPELSLEDFSKSFHN